MKPSSCVVWLALAAVGCAPAVPALTAELCDLAGRVDAVYDAVEEEREFTPVEKTTVRDLVDQMKPLVPAELDETFRLRYWPHTSVSGLDTGGVSTQRAYDHWRNTRNASC